MVKLDRKAARKRRHNRIRKKVSGTAERPRLCVYFSGKHIYAQIIDDDANKTLVCASTLQKDLREQNVKDNVEGAVKVGKLVAERALEAGISTVVFDRGGFQYHGRVKALADAAREAGLKF